MPVAGGFGLGRHQALLRMPLPAFEKLKPLIERAII
jgi:hypothetical protein